MPSPRLLGGRRVMSRPPIRTSPVSGASNPATIRSMVVLPQPDGPSTASISPGGMDRLSGWSAWMAPKRRLTPRNSSAAPVTEAAWSQMPFHAGRRHHP